MRHTRWFDEHCSDYDAIEGLQEYARCGLSHNNRDTIFARIWTEKMHDILADNDTMLEALKNLERVSGIASTYDDPVRVSARKAIAKAQGAA